MTTTQKTPRAEFLWANAHMKKNHCCTDINTEVPWAKLTMGETLAQEEKPQTLMTLTQRTLWAEFIWAKRLYKKKNPWLSWHLHRRLRGQNSYGRTLTWRKTTALLDINTEDTMGRIPMGETLAQEKNPGYPDINTEDSAGRIPMGERSHEETPQLHWHQDGKTRRAEFLWANAHMKKPHGSTDIKTEKLGGQNSYGRTLTQEETPRLYWHQHERAESLWNFYRTLWDI